MLGGGALPLAAQGDGFMVGADLSFLAQAELHGVAFRDQGVAKPGLQIFKDHGYNWIRLRLFHTPAGLPNDRAYTIAEAQAAKKLGYKFLLDFHYSDDWADPAHESAPRAWASLTHKQLVKAVFEYTRDTIAAFGQAGVMPDMVQIGNEVTAGMIWPDGRLPDNWDNFAELVQAGIRGVDAGRGKSHRPLIMIHIDKGGDQGGCKWFFDNLNSHNIAFDVIGVSFYPWWHGGVPDLRNTLAFLAREYRMPIVVVETAYNWRPTEYAGRKAPYPETAEGQRQYFADVARTVRQTPGGFGKGVFWWEPAVQGPLEIRGLFDEQHNALPALSVFDKPAAGTAANDGRHGNN
jgi:arabinogalactan endo-1,4-beta-galactosidase